MEFDVMFYTVFPGLSAATYFSDALNHGADTEVLLSCEFFCTCQGVLLLKVQKRDSWEIGAKKQALRYSHFVLKGLFVEQFQVGLVLIGNRECKLSRASATLTCSNSSMSNVTVMTHRKRTLLFW